MPLTPHHQPRIARPVRYRQLLKQLEAHTPPCWISANTKPPQLLWTVKAESAVAAAAPPLTSSAPIPPSCTSSRWLFEDADECPMMKVEPFTTHTSLPHTSSMAGTSAEVCSVSSDSDPELTQSQSPPPHPSRSSPRTHARKRGRSSVAPPTPTKARQTTSESPSSSVEIFSQLGTAQHPPKRSAPMRAPTEPQHQSTLEGFLRRL